MSVPASATVLVIEENAAVFELIEQVLRESGHHVLSTKNALEAVEIAGRIRIDVVVAGVLLEVRRQTLLSELRSIQPELHIVVCDPDNEIETIDRATTLSSPLSLGDLRDAIAASLDLQSRATSSAYGTAGSG